MTYTYPGHSFAPTPLFNAVINILRIRLLSQVSSWVLFIVVTLDRWTGYFLVISGRTLLRICWTEEGFFFLWRRFEREGAWIELGWRYWVYLILTLFFAWNIFSLVIFCLFHTLRLLVALALFIIIVLSTEVLYVLYISSLIFPVCMFLFGFLLDSFVCSCLWFTISWY